MNIPGYIFDGKRYFKIPPGQSEPSPAPSSSSSSSNKAQEPNGNQSNINCNSRFRKGKWINREQLVFGDPIPENQNILGKKRKKYDAEKTIEKGKGITSPGIGNNSTCSRWNLTLRSSFSSIPARENMHYHIDTMAMKRLELTRRIAPDCFPVDENISALDIDDADPSLVRLGGLSGYVGTGSLSGDEGDEPWRLGWMFPSRITSIHTKGSRILATCLGQPAQALVGTTTDNLSLASVTLSPPKTSIWTSALSSEVIALGCDTKVRMTKDPLRNVMDGYVTGGRHGGGAVFALELDKNLIFAGCRSGQVKIFDHRSSPSQSETITSESYSRHGHRPGVNSKANDDQPESKAEIQFSMASSITHLKRIGEDRLLVAGMEGSLSIFDLRFITSNSSSTNSSNHIPHNQSFSSPVPFHYSSKPCMILEGHCNSYSNDLGLDLWKQDWLAAAGQDQVVRIWSLREGGQPIVSPSHSLVPKPTTHPSLLNLEGGGRSHYDSSTHRLPMVAANNNCREDEIPLTSPLLSSKSFVEPVRALRFADSELSTPSRFLRRRLRPKRGTRSDDLHQREEHQDWGVVTRDMNFENHRTYSLLTKNGHERGVGCWEGGKIQLWIGTNDTLECYEQP